MKHFILVAVVGGMFAAFYWWSVPSAQQRAGNVGSSVDKMVARGGAGVSAAESPASRASSAGARPAAKSVFDTFPAMRAMRPYERFNFFHYEATGRVKPLLEGFIAGTEAPVDVYARLLASARQGEVASAMAATQLLETCADSRISADGGSTRALTRFRGCQLIPPQDVVAGFGQLRALADAGDPFAAYQLMLNSTRLEVTAPVLHSPTELSALQESLRNAHMFFEPIGDSSILGIIGSAYEDNAVLPESRVTRLAYGEARYAMILAEGGGSPRGALMSMQERLPGLTAAQQEQAAVLANQILSRCCPGNRFNPDVLKK